ncbi:hypothetical protein P152DRAFT_808 [Eremomyces bilateralis CBS 781.70]|uniref:Uncharacterized protein n=1 Tax=Eremomyces bilateralis CBS 781.70 TaxID=1392243 RepID=A0A6G1GFE8_9PEZI|nr:uncharacterized protein P152DRAFT_808 [Eremomyces bilateralis CBS 781.70]KAF1816798.1 hypothetical protein P152DRAFT_808 [Eremomyces bilateralis CBS 781.70]
MYMYINPSGKWLWVDSENPTSLTKYGEAGGCTIFSRPSVDACSFCLGLWSAIQVRPFEGTGYFTSLESGPRKSSGSATIAALRLRIFGHGVRRPPNDKSPKKLNHVPLGAPVGCRTKKPQTSQTSKSRSAGAWALGFGEGFAGGCPSVLEVWLL